MTDWADIIGRLIRRAVAEGDTRLTSKPRINRFNQSFIPSPLKNIFRSKHRPHQGETEKARRRKQIAMGTLTISNGLRRGASE